MFGATGLGERITLTIRGRSSEIELPEKADVLVSEIIGHEPLAEQILGTFCDAAARLLNPGARLVPSALRIYATPLVVPNKVRQRVLFTAEVLNRWQRWYGLPFRALLDTENAASMRVSLIRSRVNAWSARDWSVLGQAAILHDFDLKGTSIS